MLDQPRHEYRLLLGDCSGRSPDLPTNGPSMGSFDRRPLRQWESPGRLFWHLQSVTRLQRCNNPDAYLLGIGHFVEEEDGLECHVWNGHFVSTSNNLLC